MPDDNLLGTEQSVNPRGFDVGATSPLGSVPGPTAPPPNLASPGVAPRPSPAQVMSQQLQAADTAHHSTLGKAFRSIMGNDISYQINPQTGKMEQTETPQKPGQFWRGIIAATVLGGATAAKNKAPGFIQGAAEGGEAVIDKAQQQDELKRKQAQEQFKDQLAARSANTEEDLKRMQIAHLNAQTLRENQIMQRTDYDFHKEIGEQGLKDLQPFIDADPSLVKFKDIDEAEKNDLLKNNPQALHLMWRPSGTKIVFEDNGKPNVHATYTGVDPEGNVKATDDQIKHWKEVGIDKYLGKGTWDVLTKDKELTAKQYIAVLQHAKTLNNALLINKKNKLDEEAEQAKIGLEKAQTAHFYAEADRIKKEGGDKAKAEKTYLDAADALDKLVKDGKGFDDLPIKYQDALADHSQAEAKDKADMLKTMIAAGQGSTDEAAKLLKEWTDLTSVHTRTQVNKTKQAPPPDNKGVTDKMTNVSRIMTEDKGIQAGTEDAYRHVESSDLSPEEKRKLNVQMNNWVPEDKVQEMATKAQVPVKDMEQQLREKGYTLAKDKRWEASQSLETLPVGP